MTQWQYCRVSVTTTSITEDDRRELQRQGSKDEIITDGDQTALRIASLRVLGEPGPKQKVADFDEAVARLGRDGWEMVSHSQTAVVGPDERMTASSVLYFKRPTE